VYNGVEVNVFPSMTCSSVFDKLVKTKLLCDTLTLVGVKGYDKEKVSKMPMEKVRKSGDVVSRGVEEVKEGLGEGEGFTEDELGVMMDYDDENSRKGNFSRIFPLKSNISYYKKYFTQQRYLNELVWSYI